MTVRVLFLCTGNRARSQMAEGLARTILRPDVDVASAGTKPNPKGVHPVAVEMLEERGIDATHQRPKHVNELSGEFDYVHSCPNWESRLRDNRTGLLRYRDVEG
jgi:arsenate reductase